MGSFPFPLAVLGVRVRMTLGSQLRAESQFTACGATSENCPISISNSSPAAVRIW